MHVDVHMVHRGVAPEVDGDVVGAQNQIIIVGIVRTRLADPRR